MKKIILVLLFLSSTGIFAQQNINNYKYILISKHFDFLKKPDQYQTSSLTKFLFNKYGFIAFFNDEKLPEELVKNRCLALTANVKNISGMFTTKIRIELKDCHNKVVFLTKEGKSKQKDYKNAYQGAIRLAFQSVRALHYVYHPAKNAKTTTPLIAKIDIKSEVQSPVKKAVISLYAQPIAKGFQLVDTKPAVIFQILNTNIKGVFILKNRKGIFYKNGMVWIAEYYKNSELIQELYQVKF